MPDKVFICYRHQDSAGYAGRLASDLSDRLGSEQVFRDEDSIPLGRDFPSEIRETIRSCAAMVALIGQQWLTILNARREDPEDWVRIELITALDLGVLVIPVCLDGAKLPPAGELPSTLKRLSSLQKVDLGNANWELGRDRLIEAIRVAPPNPRPEPDPPDDPDAALDAELKRYRDAGVVGDVAALFRAFTHPSEHLRTRAQQAMHAVQWSAIAAAVERLARRQDAGPINDVLNGLAALEPHQQTVGLLRRLVTTLKGDLRNRAILLKEKKELRLEERKLADLFTEHESAYEIEKALGQGLFTASYLAHHRENEMPFVVRVLRPEFVRHDHIRTEFVEMARHSARYRHHHLVVTLDSGQYPEEEVYFSVRDYVEGPTLQSVLDTGHRFALLPTLEMLRQLITALEPIHELGRVHLGIKPSNIFFAGQRRVRLGDPSLSVPAVASLSERLSYDYRYIAPECFLATDTIAASADIYSLGCVAFELLKGRPPFVADDSARLAKLHESGSLEAPQRDDPPILQANGLVRRMLARQPEQRPSDLNNLTEILEAEIARVRGAPGRASITLLDKQAQGNIAATCVGLEVGADPGDAFGTIVEPTPPVAALDPGEAPTVLAPAAPSPAHRADRPVKPIEVPVAPRSGEAAPAPVQGEPTAQSSSTSAQPAFLPPRSGDDPMIGRVIGRSWRVVRRIGGGGMGTVFEVVHVRTHYLRRAIKQIKSGLEQNAEVVRRFRREVNLMAQLESADHIVRVHDFEEEEGFGTYVLMDLIDGPSLGDMIRQQRGRGLSYEDVLHYGTQIARALQGVHRIGVVHRDIKAANVLIDIRQRKAFLTDFGISKELAGAADDETMDETSSTIASQYIGTPRFSAPEQLRVEYPPKPIWDIYSMGAVLYESCSGLSFLPQLKSYPEFLRHVGMNPQFRIELAYPTPPPPRFAALVDRCLRLDPNERMPSAAELAAALEECERERQGTTPAVPDGGDRTPIR